MKWDKPDNKKLGYYPVVTLKFGIVTFPEKNVQLNLQRWWNPIRSWIIK